MIPHFDEYGNLPPGVYFCDWEEFQALYNTSIKRQRMIQGLALAMSQLKTAGCKTIYIDGSFITTKPLPGDFDSCWEEEGVDLKYLKFLAPSLYNFGEQRAQQKSKYKGEFFPANYPANETGVSYLEFFQFDTRTGHSKGIIAIDLERLEL